jgi:general secretion pathway protein E
MSISDRDPPSGAATAEDLLEFLVARGVVAEGAPTRVRALRSSREESDAAMLVALGLADERALAAALAEFLRLPLVGAEDFPSRPVQVARIAPEFLRRARILPLAESADALDLAMADPTDAYALRAVRLATGRPVRACVAVPSEIMAALDRLERPGGAATAATAEAAPARADDLRRLGDLASDEPVIRFVNTLVARAVAARASDIHVEAAEAQVTLRLRIDGLLRPIEPPPAALAPNIVNRIKILSGLDVAQRRLPQDGRFRVTAEGREIDIRISTVPTLHGESVVLRLLDRQRAPLDLAELGFGQGLRDGLEGLLGLASGMVLVTGPTGSGKTSTLYALLQRLNAPERKILTVEDPVEYQLPGVNQIAVNAAIGLDFAHVLRSLLRQDPDVLLVGEIRDAETARVAAQASLTGHLMLSTVHTNDAVGTIARLLDIGLEGLLVTSVLRAVLAQRLVRRLCTACRAPVFVGRAALARAGMAALLPPDADGATLHRAVGCPACGGTGYRGRVAIGELLTMSDELGQEILRGADLAALRRCARNAGMVEMRLDGMRKALDGATTLEEILRVTGGA